jgi:hypothetical protein
MLFHGLLKASIVHDTTYRSFVQVPKAVKCQIDNLIWTFFTCMEPVRKERNELEALRVKTSRKVKFRLTKESWWAIKAAFSKIVGTE